MAYDKSKDITIFENVIGDGLMVSVMQYNGGEKKLQIGPRIYTKKDGSEGYRKAGRMTAAETIELFNLQSNINAILNSNLSIE